MVSIIIPTYNESVQVTAAISSLQAANTDHHPVEIIVVDGGSTDNTVELARQCGARVIQGARKGRAVQLNTGASAAAGDILYFLHADTLPPPGFLAQLVTACNRGAVGGCFRLRFDSGHWFLRANAWFTRFNLNALRFGDQSLFVTREVFHRSGGYREDLLLMEDQEIIRRIKHHGPFHVLPNAVVTSARKYRRYGVYRTQSTFYLIWALYYLGVSQEKLVTLHRRRFGQGDS